MLANVMTVQMGWFMAMCGGCVLVFGDGRGAPLRTSSWPGSTAFFLLCVLSRLLNRPTVFHVPVPRICAIPVNSGTHTSAPVQLMSDMGLTSEDVGIKINNRKILTELMGSLGIPEEKFAPTCVLIDKLEKVPVEALQSDMQELGLSTETVSTLLDLIQDASLEGPSCLSAVFGPPPRT